MSDFVEKIFRTKVTAQLLQKVLAALAAMDAADRRDFTGRAVVVARVLHEEGLLEKQPACPPRLSFGWRLSLDCRTGKS
jgi:hypothetical protein